VTRHVSYPATKTSGDQRVAIFPAPIATDHVKRIDTTSRIILGTKRLA